MTYLVRVLALLGSPNLNGLPPYRWLGIAGWGCNYGRLVLFRSEVMSLIDTPSHFLSLQPAKLDTGDGKARHSLGCLPTC